MSENARSSASASSWIFFFPAGATRMSMRSVRLSAMYHSVRHQDGMTYIVRHAAPVLFRSTVAGWAVLMAPHTVRVRPNPTRPTMRTLIPRRLRSLMPAHRSTLPPSTGAQ